MSSSSADRLARWTSRRNADTTPQPTPGPEHSLSLSLQERGSESEPSGSSLTKGGRRTRGKTDRYAAALTDAHRAALTSLVEGLRQAAPEACADAAKHPWAWGKRNGIHPRFAFLIALDWRYLRRPRLDSLERLAAALGLPAELARQLAAAHPLAIAPPEKEQPR